MRHIGHVQDPTLASAAALVLLADGLHTELRDDDAGGVDVWAQDDARMDEARGKLDAFLANPRDPAWAAAQKAGAARLADTQAKDERYKRRLRLAAQSVHGANEFGWMTISILTIAVAVAMLSQLGSNLTAVQHLFLTNYPPFFRLPELRAGEVWRLFTPIFVHFGVLHLLFNGLNWWEVGQQLESRKGVTFFAPMVLVTAAVTNLGQFAWSYWVAPLEAAAVGGLSGVLYAMFGYAWIKGRVDPADGIGVTPRTATTMFIWLFVCMTGFLGPIANAAHVVGLVCGIVWAYAEVALFAWRKNR